MTLRGNRATIPALAFLLTSLPSLAQKMQVVPDAQLDSLKTLPACVPAAPSGYAGGKCVVTIDRQAPISPPALLVPPGTDVFVRVIHTRGNEVVLFSLATTHTTPPDVAGAAVKGVLTPLQSLVFTQKIEAVDGGQHTGDEIQDRQENQIKKLNGIEDEIRHAAAALTCLSNYQTLQPDHTCSQAALVTLATFDDQKENAKNAASDAAKRHLPLKEIDDLKGAIDKGTADCLTNAGKAAPAEQETKKQECIAAANRHLTNQARLSSAIADIQKAQSALLVSVKALEDWKKTPDTVAYQFTSSKLNNMVATITGQEVVNKTTSPVATVTINTQNTNWVVSTGILFSNLKFHTFTNAPVIVNGTPVLDASGKVTTVVTSADTSPSVVAPELLVSYRLPWFSRFGWENKCRGGCSFLLSGGVGANLTSKSADFDSGFSFQIGSVLFTPTVHYGRENRLSNGVAVGQQLGASPPNPLPTNYQWVKKFGIAVTYALPIP